MGAVSYGSVPSILRDSCDRISRREALPDAPSVLHGDIRGGDGSYRW